MIFRISKLEKDVLCVCPEVVDGSTDKCREIDRKQHCIYQETYVRRATQVAQWRSRRSVSPSCCAVSRSTTAYAPGLQNEWRFVT